MTKLAKLLAQLRDVDARLDALLAHDELTDEQRAEHDQLVANRAKVVAAIDKEKARLAREQERAKLEADAAEAETAAEQAQKNAVEREDRKAKAGPGRLIDSELPAPKDVPAERRDAERAAAEPQVPASAKRYGSLKHFQGARGGADAEQRAYRFGMWAMAQLHRQLPHRYPQLGFAQDWVKKHMAAVGSNDATGYSYLIPEEFSSDIIDLREQFGVARRILKVKPMMSETLSVPRREGGLTAYYVGQNVAITESNKTWDEVTLTARTLAVISRVSREVNADLAISWGDDLAGEIAYAFASAEDDAAFNGDGTSTYGGIRGVRTKLQDVDGAGTDSYGLVTGAGNAYSELVMADFHKVVGRLPQYADTPMAAWVCHRTFYYEVMEKLLVASGGTPASEAATIGKRGRPMFLGYPVEFSQKYPATEANSQVTCTLGDHSKGALFGDRQKDEIEFSDQAYVNGQSLWERNQLGIRGLERFDVIVHDVGSSSASGPIVGLQTAGS